MSNLLSSNNNIPNQQALSNNQSVKYNSGCGYYLSLFIVFYVNFNTLYFFAKLHHVVKSTKVFIIALFILFFIALFYQFKSAKIGYLKTFKLYFLFLILNFALVFISGLSKTTYFSNFNLNFSNLSSKLASGVQNIINNINNFVSNENDKELLMLESDFIKNPSDPVIVYNLANKYISTNNLFYINQAISLLESLLETIPTDLYLSTLADAYLLIGRTDLAFMTAKKRLWFEFVSINQVAKHIALLAIQANELLKGIYEIENLLELVSNSSGIDSYVEFSYLINEAELDEVKLILASLYIDVGNKAKAKSIVDQVMKGKSKFSVNYDLANYLLNKCK